jgi:hypothetical protein
MKKPALAKAPSTAIKVTTIRIFMGPDYPGASVGAGR